MKRAARKPVPVANNIAIRDYTIVLNDMVRLLEEACRSTVRSVNAIMTATYWEIGRRIVEYEQGGKGRAEYGEKLLA